LIGRSLNDVDHRTALIAGSGDIKEDEFIRSLLFIGRRDGDGIASIAQFFKFHPLDHATRMDIETRNDANRQHGRDEAVGMAQAKVKPKLL
jgi:hypothetical protein